MSASRELPIYEVESQLIAALESGQRVLLQAPTGSGKSTQVPQMLVDRGLIRNGDQVVILQPRRLPTRMLAARVAQERGTRLGGEVGYQMRFESVCNRDTRIRYVTEGTLVRQIAANPSLEGIGAILFDEFHERHIQGDICLSLALQIASKTRPDLRIVVMSATIDTASLSQFLSPCELIRSEGRMHPVDIRYSKTTIDFDRTPPWDAAARAVETVWEGSEGDVLVFMPGSYEIHRTINALGACRLSGKPLFLPLHGELPAEQQDMAIARTEQRKVIVATNVAETSLTIPGVRVVVDSGLARIPRYDPNRGINTLLVEKISRASADQRAGRAGRVAPGICVRLWTAREHEHRAIQELPEVRRIDLAEVLLDLKSAGVQKVSAFPWVDAPDAKSLERALLLLRDLGAIDDDERLTPLGERMCAFPVHPRYSRLLLAAAERRCVPQSAAVAALTQTRSLLIRNVDKRTAELREDLLESGASSDFEVLLRAWRYADRNQYRTDACRKLGIHAQTARQVSRIHEQFLRIAAAQGLPLEDNSPEPNAVFKTILAGFSDQVARRLDSGTLRCDLVHHRRGTLARESVAREAALLVAAEVREIESRPQDPSTLITLATAIEESWLEELFPQDFTTAESVTWDAAQRKVVARKERRFRDLILETTSSGSAPPAEAARILAEKIMDGSCPLAQWTQEVDQWILRVNNVSTWFPEAEISPVTEEAKYALLEQLCHGATSYKEVKDRPVWPVLKSWLSAPMQQFVEANAPERLELPNGRKAKITYSAEGQPVLAARIQDLYGVTESLRIAQNRVSLVIQVLAPNFRPVQITSNLATFWKEAYPKLKHELQRKYPKHEWR